MTATTPLIGMDLQSHHKWPDDPYKGLAFYRREDIPLFAGRSTDVTRAASMLGDGKTRILLLHGSTGCGKSSFLHAGLIPFLENQIGRFTFARENDQKETALFIRSTHNPLLELAWRAYEAAERLQQETPQQPPGPGDGADGADSSSAAAEGIDYAVAPVVDVKKYSTAALFAVAVLEDPERLVEVIGRIAYRRPRTQALVVDQAEEVLTLKPGPDGEAFRRQFFKFLAYLSRSALNFRLIVAFRTEYHGRFYASLKASRIDASCVEDYYLADLSRRDMEEAIKRPCSQQEIPGYGVPREHYSFTYEDGLPERIADDLDKTRLTSGTLPVLQIVCRRLYQKAKGAPQVGGLWVIRKRDYEELGGIHGQVDSHLQQALERCCETELSLLQLKFEVMRWRDVLSELAKPQADGSITTDVKSAKILRETAQIQGCKMSFETVMSFLERDEWRIVRQVEVTVVSTHEKLQCYSLGHDVLGGVLERWRIGRCKDRRGARRVLVMYGVALMIVGVFVGSLLEGGAREFGLEIRSVLFVLGAAFWLLAAIPNRKGFHVIYRSVYGWLTNIFAITRLGEPALLEHELSRLRAGRRF